MENEIKKCKFCGNEDESQLVVVPSTDMDGNKYNDGYQCLKCAIERKAENREDD